MNVTFELADLLKAERAGRALAHHCSPCTNCEAIVSTSLRGAAALAALRHLANRGARATALLCDSDLQSHDAFAIMLEAAGCMNLGIRQCARGEGSPESDCVIDGTDSATHDPRAIAVSDFLLPQHKLQWDSAVAREDNIFLSPALEAQALPAEAIRAIDRAAIEDYGLPGLCLMENAATGAVAIARDMLKDALPETPVMALVGYGNNGGDALAVVRGLLEMDIPARAVLLGDPEKLKGDAKENLDILRQQSDAILPFPGADSLSAMLKNSPLVVDGIFGTGLDRPVEGVPAQAIRAANESGARILALDLPSGLHADSGETLGISVRAGETATFAAPKTGFWKNDGPACCGRITVADIGCPRDLLEPA